MIMVKTLGLFAWAFSTLSLLRHVEAARRLPKQYLKKRGLLASSPSSSGTVNTRNTIRKIQKQCTPVDFVPVEEVHAIVTSMETDCVYYIDHEMRFDLSASNSMECIGDEMGSYSGKKEISDDGDHGRRNVRKTRAARKLQNSESHYVDDNHEMTSKEFSMDTCNFNLEDNVSIGLTLPRMAKNECVNALSIKAVCYNSIPDLRLLCPEDYVAYAGTGSTIDPRASLPAEDFGSASSSRLAAVTPTTVVDGAQHYDISLGCADQSCYEAALEECFGDVPFVEEGTCEDGENAFSFRIKGCTPNGPSGGDNNWETRLFAFDSGAAEEEDLCTNAFQEQFLAVSKIEYTIKTTNNGNSPSIDATVLRTDGSGEKIDGLGDDTATDGVLSIDPWNAIPTGDNVLCNQIEVQIRDNCGTSAGDQLGECGDGSAVELTNFSVDGVDLPTISFSTLTAADPSNTLALEAEQSFCVKKLSGDFTNSVITGILNTEFWRGSGAMRVDIRLVCVESFP